MSPGFPSLGALLPSPDAVSSPSQAPSAAAVLALPPSGQVQAYVLDSGVSGLLHEQCPAQSRHTAEVVQPRPTGLVKGLPSGIALNINQRERTKKSTQ